ncbi:hypothetical protein O0I10_007776 [Lichtheimia ornata]|uniref:Uncharacterized protein n=1 Tax=Lichtheimia ornata TaxID=688661 RepID=A0AAD7XXD4_9FUNG|nr:uncharacterized protein O0I10_007776 [Lichtheimia ornata]KAJ8656453.1 hypothetical protein O0I10_007776 [Lichtheimia ornata]
MGVGTFTSFKPNAHTGCKYPSLIRIPVIATLWVNADLCGPNLTYYLMELKADGLYLMEELVTIRMPLCIKDIYLASLSQIKNVTHHFYHHCKQSDASAMIIISKRNRVSPTAENLDHVIEKTIDRKRHNHVKY